MTFARIRRNPAISTRSTTPQLFAGEELPSALTERRGTRPVRPADAGDAGVFSLRDAGTLQAHRARRPFLAFRGELMKAIAARPVEHAKPLDVTEVDLPAPGDGEALVDMLYGGVNPVDRYRAAGRVDAGSPVPRTLGAEGAGTFRGRPVVVFGHGVGRTRDGIWATRAIVPRAALIDVPARIDLRHAAVMGVAGVTAWRTVTELAQVTKDDRVLVLGAAGGGGVDYDCRAG